MSLIRKSLERIAAGLGGYCAQFARRLHSPDPHEKILESWFSGNCERTLRQHYALNGNSLVFDLGGYDGQWCSDIFARYCCSIHVFEPVPEFAANISRRFAHNPKIKVNPFGIGKDTSRAEIALSRDGSSMFKKDGDPVKIDIVMASDYFEQHRITFVDLMKINIEGAEYDLLDHLIERQLTTSIRDIQIQFHDFIPDAARRRMEIRHCLQKTHFLTYDYPFVWENWHLRDPETPEGSQR